VQIVFVPSNLGKSEIMYFICPVSHKRCRILYKGYNSPVWKCREAYQNRIYYRGQLSSKKGKYNDRYWELEKQIDDLLTQRKTYTYKGKLTKRAERIESLKLQKSRMDEMRWSLAAMPVSLQRILKYSI